MGAYLAKPITEKESETGEGNGLRFGATSMQGWRVNQEDAHNCVLGLAEGWNMLAVYDGHGGAEVAKYTASRFPEFMVSREFWKNDDLSATMQTLFVDFDDELRSEKFLTDVKQFMEKEPADKGENSDDEADRIETIEESRIPLKEILKRYGAVLGMGQDVGSLLLDYSKEEDDDDGPLTSKAQRKEKKKRHTKSPAQLNEIKRMKTDGPEGSDSTEPGVPEAETPSGDSSDKTDKPAVVAEQDKVTEEKNKVVAEGSAEEPGASSSVESDGQAEVQDDSEEEDSDYKEAEEGDDDDEEEDDDEDEEESDEDDDDEEPMMFGGGGEAPGEDSGTTACVCLISKEKIIVANAGDSRAVLSRNGKAIDLSVDHKPEDEIEKTRIHRAGGTVSNEGRVNGGLNLSRALGDHSYKKNTELPLAEQMISALPDIKTEDLTDEDEFVVIACDGIWNSMESQQVIDFVRERLQNGKDCKEISEELCDHCLAPDTSGDGTGCDNMTVIVAQIVR